ncbi:MAG: hypothetical protein ACI9BO_002000 [Zhongshania sp.]|jgi:hypothetical protein
MLRTKLLKSAVYITLALSTSAMAGETGEIQTRVGFIDEQTGAKVEAVEIGEKSGEYRVLISVPRKGDSPAMEIEEVLVSAPAINAEDLPVAPRYEFVNDYSNDRYGFYVYIGKNKEYPFRIYFKDPDAEIMENR